jgi:hypothetical protein
VGANLIETDISAMSLISRRFITRGSSTFGEGQAFSDIASRSVDF